MRAVLAVGLLITLGASANAAPVHRFQPREGHLRPGERVTAPTPRFPDGPTKRPDSGCTTAAPPLAWADSRQSRPILTIRAGAHDGVANVAAGVLKPNLMVLADCEPTSASRAF